MKKNTTALLATSLLTLCTILLISSLSGCGPKPQPRKRATKPYKRIVKRTPPPAASPSVVTSASAVKRQRISPPARQVTILGTQKILINSVTFEVPENYVFFTWEELPTDVIYDKGPLRAFTNIDGTTHYYQAVYVASGNLNWYQAAYLAQDAGGYLASITSPEENDFVFSLVSSAKYFWKFPPYQNGRGHMNHHEISIGPFLGGYQVTGSVEPAGGWQWLSGEQWGYHNWANDLGDGVIDKDPRDNTQPNDSGNSRFGQRTMGYGEMNTPVDTWGDYMDDVGTYGMSRTPGKSHGFVIEYKQLPKG